MLINKTSGEIITTGAVAYYEKIASREEKYLEAEEELRAISTCDAPPPSRNGESAWIDTIIVQTSDGPENAMFCASSANQSSAHQGGIQF